MSETSKIHKLSAGFIEWVNAGSPAAPRSFDSSEHSIPTNWRFLGIAASVIVFFSVVFYSLGGKDVNTARSIDILALEVAGLSKIVGPIPSALDEIEEQIGKLRDEVVRLQSNQTTYDIELARTQAEMGAIKEVLTNNILNGDKRSIDLFNSLNTKVVRNEAKIVTIKTEFGIAHPKQ